VGVAEFAEVQQRLHHRLLQRLLSLLNGVLVPIDAAWVVLLLRSLQEYMSLSAQMSKPADK
jgi:hypothetical protein